MNAPLPPDFAAQLKGLASGAQTPEKPAYERYLKIGYLGVAALVLGLFGWAAVSPIKGAVIAPGFVAVEGKPAIIQHLDGGVVGDILVRDGASVKAGDPLIRLDPTEIDANQAIITVQLNETRARVQRLIAERDGLNEIDVPEDLREAAASEPRGSLRVRRVPRSRWPKRIGTAEPA